MAMKIVYASVPCAKWVQEDAPMSLLGAISAMEQELNDPEDS